MLNSVHHLTAEELIAGLDGIRESPRDEGRIERIVRRPADDQREVLDQGELDPEVGLLGDVWPVKPSTTSPDGKAHPEKQITVMNARLAALVAGSPDRWQLAGDQLYADFDLSQTNLPPGIRLAVGTAVIEVTEPPHMGCAKFAARFGREALRFVNSPDGRELRLRGMNTKVVHAGVVRPGDPIRKLT